MHRTLSAALALGLAAATALSGVAGADDAPSPPAYGNQENFGWSTGEGVGSVASTPAVEGSDAAAPSGRATRQHVTPVCRYEPLSTEDSATANDMAKNGWGPSPGEQPGAWYRQVCTVNAQGDTNGTVMWLHHRQAAPVVHPATLARHALDYTALDPPAVTLNPPAGRDQLVGVPTWLWLRNGWKPERARASAGGVTVTTTATPRTVVWTMGDGHRVTCAGPGTPYDATKPDAAPSCSYTYTTSSAGQPGDAYTVTATETWAVAWSAEGAPAGDPTSGDLPAVTRTSRLAVRVAETQAVNTGG